MSTNVKTLQGRHRAAVDTRSAAAPTLLLVGASAVIILALAVAALAWQAVV